MLDRYSREPMRSVWTSQAEFDGLWKVELAVIEARERLGRIPEGTHVPIVGAVKIRPERVAEIEADVHHDVIAFVMHIREQLEAAGLGHLSRHIHDGVTTFDIRDPALMLQLQAAVQIVIEEVKLLQEALRRQAVTHKWTLMMARTHGQFAQPTTFGHLLLVFWSELGRSKRRLELLKRYELNQAKLSGAVGTYAEVGPELEREVLADLGLEPAMAETQILQRDRHAAVVSVLAILAGTMEQIARTFWEMMRSDVAELREPRGAKQKGSSAMPQKRNPIKTEQLQGLARVVRAWVIPAIEDIATPEFRAIEQSSAERHIFPDAFGVVHYMLMTLRRIVESMEVLSDRMRDRVNEESFGVWAAQRIRDELMRAEVDPETAYRTMQRLAFQATDTSTHLRDLCLDSRVLPGEKCVADIIDTDTIEDAFNAKEAVYDGVEEIFRRCGIGREVND